MQTGMLLPFPLTAFASGTQSDKLSALETGPEPKPKSSP